MEAFLERAGLTGRKLDVAKKALEDNMIDTVAELTMLSQRAEEYVRVLPVGGIRLLISAALDDQESAAPNTKNDQISTTEPTQGLPPGKRFFIVVPLAF